MGLMRSALLAGSRNAWLRERAMRTSFVRKSVSRFMPGETLDEALAAARSLQQSERLGSILTHLGENLTSPSEAEEVTAHYLDVLERVRSGGYDCEISVKPTQLGLDLDPELAFRNLAAIARRALELSNFVWIDMESTPYVDPTLSLFHRVRSEAPSIGVCLQAYLHRTRADLEALLPLGPAIRIVKGAYSEPPSLAIARKADVDENFYFLCTRMLRPDSLERGARVAIGTHDGRLVERLQRFVTEAAVPRGRYEFEMLYGIQRGLQRRLLAEGWPLRVLISYGEFWFPWYMRRLAERPANVLFVVRSMFR
ncbi:MAG: proline dehydrogenase [Acidobacteria bacterium]|nr:MAG: proline dehydrogenase [Acidobacteriota bacterium]RPJ85345.1 MAG: proline dehydrogenase [Acidobacteriota bacterium]